MKNKISKFIRQQMAGYLARRADEWGGVLHDYKNGKWEQIGMWEDEKGQNEVIGMIGNMMNSGRDEIYITTVKVGIKCGYFVVADSNHTWWTRWFWGEIYPPAEAFSETQVKCRQIADKMGFRRPDEG